MSIVTLKRKVQAQYNNVSVGQSAFSLNGTRRSAGYVGQDMLGRSLIRSLSRNGSLKGHGGCCGKYPIQEVKTTPEMSGLNNPATVKTSSLNTTGLFMSKYRWIRRPQPYSTTKPGDAQNNNAQSTYIEHISRKAINDAATCPNIPVKTCSSGCPPITKPKEATGALDENDRLQSLVKKCTNNDDFQIPKTVKRTPLIGT
jgi:hypothetical protein